MPSKALCPMAGLDRKVPKQPEDYKGHGALKSCIYRSFIYILWCGFSYNKEQGAIVVPCPFYVSMAENLVPMLSV